MYILYMNTYRNHSSCMIKQRKNDFALHREVRLAASLLGKRLWGGRCFTWPINGLKKTEIYGENLWPIWSSWRSCGDHMVIIWRFTGHVVFHFTMTANVYPPSSCTSDIFTEKIYLIQSQNLLNLLVRSNAPNNMKVAPRKHSTWQPTSLLILLLNRICQKKNMQNLQWTNILSAFLSPWDCNLINKKRIQCTQPWDPGDPWDPWCTSSAEGWPFGWAPARQWARR